MLQVQLFCSYQNAFGAVELNNNPAKQAQLYADYLTITV